MTRSFVPNFGLKDFLFHLQSGHIRAVNVEWVLNIPLHPMRRKILVNASPAPHLLLLLLLRVRESPSSSSSRLLHILSLSRYPHPFAL